MEGDDMFNTKSFTVAHRRVYVTLILTVLLVFTSLIAVSGNALADVGYKLPYPGNTQRFLTQGWNTGTHTGAQYYAYDFSMDPGTVIVAAKEGTVAAVREVFYDWQCGAGYGGYVNYIVINHNDGRATAYLHLTHDGAWVVPGQWVQRGLHIGQSGKSGAPDCGGHLHFQKQYQGAWNAQSVPVYFDEYPGQQLFAGNWYLSQNFCDTQGCPMRPAP